MPQSLNKLQIIGHLGQDPELRYTGSGTAVANLSVATDAPMGEDETEWHSVTCWGDLAEIVAEHLEKGRRVYVEGPLQTRQWEDADGNTRSTTELHADEVIFLGSDGGASSRSESAGGGQPQKEPAGAAGEEQETFEPDDDLPF